MVFGFRVRGSRDPKGDNHILAAATVESGTEAEIDSVVLEAKGKEQEQEKVEGKEKGNRALPSSRISVSCLKPAESEEQLLQFWS